MPWFLSMHTINLKKIKAYLKQYIHLKKWLAWILQIKSNFNALALML